MPRKHGARRKRVVHNRTIRGTKKRDAKLASRARRGKQGRSRGPAPARRR